MTYVPER